MIAGFANSSTDGLWVGCIHAGVDAITDSGREAGEGQNDEADRGAGEGDEMINLKEYIGSKYKVSMMEEYRHGGDLDDCHYMIVLGRRGDIVAWDDDMLEVTVYGVPLAIKPGTLPDKTHNLALPIKLERLGWKAKNHYDDSTCFLLKKELIYEAIKAIKARKRRVVTEAMRENGRRMAFQINRGTD